MKRPILKFRISLKVKIAFFFLLLVVLMMGTVGYIFTIRELNLRKEQVALRMERLANNIATIRSVETEDWEVYQTYIDNQIKLNPDIVYIAITDEAGTLKAHALNLEWLDLGSTRSLSKWEQANIVRRLDQRQVAPESQRDIESKSVEIIVGNRNLGTVNIGFSLVDLNDEMRKNLYRSLQLDLVFIFLAMVIAFIVGSRIVNPLGKLTTAMKRIAEGNLEQELHITSQDEIGEMAVTFNYMTSGLRQKQVLEDFTRQLAYAIDLEKIANVITERVTSAMHARAGFLYLKERGKKYSFELISAYPRSFLSFHSLCLDRATSRLLLTRPNTRLLTEFDYRAALLEQLRGLKCDGELCALAPIIIRGELQGLFVLQANLVASAVREIEVTFLDTLISQASIALENALLYLELTEQERLKKEIEIARQVQLRLLPQTIPHLPGLDIDGICVPATEVGGDYYDYFRVDPHTLGIAIADVSGKGTSAAFYMAVIKGMMLSLATVYPSPKELLSELNRRIFGQMDRRIFATMVYATIDMDRRVLRLARAGHNALLRWNSKAQTIEWLIPAGIGLGLASEELFNRHIGEARIQFQSGDKFLFYTDGVSEARNAARDEFGEVRLSEMLSRMNAAGAGDMTRSIVAEVKNFVQKAPQHDDITLVAVHIA